VTRSPDPPSTDPPIVPYTKWSDGAVEEAAENMLAQISARVGRKSTDLGSERFDVPREVPRGAVFTGYFNYANQLDRTFTEYAVQFRVENDATPFGKPVLTIL
jgi:hypothetical protein